MLAKVRSCAVIGLEGTLIEVEIDLSNGLAGFMIVGLPDTAVNEAKDRVWDPGISVAAACISVAIDTFYSHFGTVFP